MQFQNRFINVDILFSDAQSCGSCEMNNFYTYKPQGLEEMLRDPHCEKAKKISTVWGANSFAPSFEIFRFESMMGEVFLQAQELLFCLLFLSRKKVRSYFWGIFFSASAEEKNSEKPIIEHKTTFGFG